MIARTFRFVLAALLCLAPVAGQAQSAGKAVFDPAAFFTGATVSRGTLKEVFSAAKDTHVTTFGTMRGDGLLVLDQKVAIGEDAVKHRVWRLRETTPGTFAGTISDATSPVSGKVSGDTLTLAYTLEGNLRVEQILTLAPGGQSADNVMKIRKLGITVARLTETIHRQPK